MERSAGEFAGVVSVLRNRFGENQSRPELPPEGAPASAYPSQDDLTRYVLQVGYVVPPTDEDARWVLRVYRADFACSVYALASLPVYLSGGPHWYKKYDPQVAQGLQDEIVTELVKAMMYPRMDLGYNQREVTAATALTWRLWHVPAIRDALKAVRNDPVIRLRRDLTHAYERMDRDLQKSGTGAGG